MEPEVSPRLIPGFWLSVLPSSDLSDASVTDKPVNLELLAPVGAPVPAAICDDSFMELGDSCEVGSIFGMPSTVSFLWILFGIARVVGSLPGIVQFG